MHVLFFPEKPQVHDVRHVSAFLRQGHRVSLASLKAPSNLIKKDLSRLGITCRVFPSRMNVTEKNGALLERVRSWITGRSPDITHAGPLHTTGFLMAATGIHPFAAVSWGYDLLELAKRSAASRARQRHAIQAADLVVVDSRILEKAAGAIGGVARGKIVRYPWGVDVERFRPTPRRRKTTITFLCSRTWEKRYGVLHVLRAFGRVSKVRPEARLVLVGDGSQASKVYASLRQPNIRPKVTLAGRVPNDQMPRLLAAADVYVSFSFVDGSSVSLLEAMATGLPAVVSDLPANREWISNSAGGWLVPVGDDKTLAKAMVRSIDAPHLRHKHGRRNALVARRRADWNRNILRVIGRYERTCRR